MTQLTTKKQTIFIDMYHQGKSIRYIADYLGVTEATVHRWKSLDFIQEQIKMKQRAVAQSVVGETTTEDLVVESLHTIRRILHHSENETNRMKCAFYIVDNFGAHLKNASKDAVTVDVTEMLKWLDDSK
jgi:hypothetical protein